MKKPVKQPDKTSTPQAGLNKLNNNAIAYTCLFTGVLLILAVTNLLFQNHNNSTLIQRSWGLNNLSYFPSGIQVFAILLISCMLIPAFNKSVKNALQNLISKLHFKKRDLWGKIMVFTTISIILSLLLFAFRIKYDFLGDRDIRVHQSVAGTYVTDEYLTMYLLHYMNLVCAKLFHINPHQTFVLHSLGAGFCFFFLGLLIADVLFESFEKSMAFFLFYVSISTILVFCGYVEIYAFPAASVSLYAYISILYLKNKVKLVLPFTALAFAVFLHLEQVSLIPSFLFLALKDNEYFNKINVKLVLVLFLLSFPAIYVLNSVLALNPELLTPLTSSYKYPQFYTAFSLSHIWEFFNSQTLSSGVLIFLLVSILIALFKKRIPADNYAMFFLIMYLFSIVIVFTANTMRGSADWDICSFPAISLSMFVAYVFLAGFNTVYSGTKLFYIVSIAIVMNAFNCFAWVDINASNKSVNKIRDMVINDPGYYYIAYLPNELELTVIFQRAGLIDDALNASELGYKKYLKTKAQATYNYITMLLIEGDTNKSITVLEGMIHYFPMAYGNFEELTQLYERKRMNDKAYKLSLAVMKLYLRYPAQVRDHTDKAYLPHILKVVNDNALTLHDTLAYKFSAFLQDSLNRLNTPVLGQ